MSDHPVDGTIDEPAPNGAGSFASGAASPDAATADPALVEQLTIAQARGFLGPGPVEEQLAHADAHVKVVRASGADLAGRACDLGSGGGLPGLVLAVRCPDVELTLLDAMVKRCAFLDEAVDALELTDRVRVVCERGEEFARRHRDHFSFVVARSFAAPPITAEIAAPMLASLGRLVVSGAPDAAQRWPIAELAKLGLGSREIVIEAGRTFVTLVRDGRCPDRFPRRTGMPTKRPLW
jgi:16S rRNA (guanine527-N7)-methyltransferase